MHLAQQSRAATRRSLRRDRPSARRRAAVPASSTSARATATRCCSPPDSMPGRWVSRSPSPTRCSRLSARGRASRQRHARDAHRHLRVLDRVELGKQMVKLEHEADLAVPERHQLGIRQCRQRHPAERDVAGVDSIEAAEHMQQRALPHTGRTDDRDHLAAFGLKIEAAKDAQRSAGGLVALDDPCGVKKRHLIQPRRLEDAKDTTYKNSFVPSCLRGLFISKRLRRIEPGGLPRRIDRRDESRRESRR